MNIQILYFPDLVFIREADYAAALTANKGVPPEHKVQDIQLYLPSALPGNRYSNKFYEYELRLREGQAYSALYDIRYQFRFRAHWSKFKTRFSRGVASNTRFNKALVQSADKIEYATATYRRAYKALAVLSSGHGLDSNWMSNLKELQDKDVRGLGDAGVSDDNRSTQNKNASEGTRVISWIWMLEGAHDGSEDERQCHYSINSRLLMYFQLALRIEWCKMRARARRWAEEVALIEEEMRRTLKFLEWQSDWWSMLGGDLAHVPDPITRAGMIAYRARQAKLRLDMRDRFKLLWSGSEALINTLTTDVESEPGRGHPDNSILDIDF